MTIALSMDQHVPSAITQGLRQRGVDIRTAREDGYAEAEDERILERAAPLDRLVYTNDDDFLAIAQRWLQTGRGFAGLAYAHPQRITVRQAIESLELIAKVSTPGPVSQCGVLFAVLGVRKSRVGHSAMGCLGRPGNVGKAVCTRSPPGPLLWLASRRWMC